MILATFRDTFQIQDHLIGEATEEKSQKTTDFWVSGYRVSANLSLCGFPKSEVSNLAKYVCVFVCVCVFKVCRCIFNACVCSISKVTLVQQ